MAVIVDLDDDASADATHPASASGLPLRIVKPVHHSLAGVAEGLERDGATDSGSGRPNPNINGFSAALSCYP
jgi:hypothetical protein